jgi:hypothetical protein
MPDKYDLALYRGDSFTWTFILWTDPTKTARFDLTGVTLKAEIRDKPAGLTIVELTCAAVGAPEDGTVQVDLSADDCKLVPERGAWDLQLTYSDGRVHTWVAGKVNNTPDVTDSTLPG